MRAVRRTGTSESNSGVPNNERRWETMKRLQAVMLVLVLLAGVATLAAAQQKGSASKTGKPGAVLADVIEWSGTVTAVDYTKRTVELKGPAGRVATVNAKNARNLDQVKVGD